MRPVAPRETVDKLVKAFGYPKSLYELTFDYSFMVRGLIVDKKRGNVIKVRVRARRQALSLEARTGGWLPARSIHVGAASGSTWPLPGQTDALPSRQQGSECGQRQLSV